MASEPSTHDKELSLLEHLVELKNRYDPQNPAADGDGYVKIPNVNPLIEAMDMRQAQRSYEANINVVTAARRMIAGTLKILNQG